MKELCRYSNPLQSYWTINVTHFFLQKTWNWRKLPPQWNHNYCKNNLHVWWWSLPTHCDPSKRPLKQVKYFPNKILNHCTVSQQKLVEAFWCENDKCCCCKILLPARMAWLIFIWLVTYCVPTKVPNFRLKEFFSDNKIYSLLYSWRAKIDFATSYAKTVDIAVTLTHFLREWLVRFWSLTPHCISIEKAYTPMKEFCR